MDYDYGLRPFIYSLRYANQFVTGFSFMMEFMRCARMINNIAGQYD